MADDYADAPLRATLGKPRHGGYAHLPGTGPAGECCRRCHHCRRKQGAASQIYCRKWTELMGGRGGRSVPTIDPGSPACKYFERRK